ncbi:MAG: DUF1361 domain-containing protein [Cyanobacteriota bacterium]|nr:DUF1361 domain-containing protein [Cyanobacteriota bacterium]
MNAIVSQTLLSQGIQAFSHSLGLMIWNSFLALIPLALSFWLFRFQKNRDLLWWVGLLVFIAFLPNAPYVLTDIIHLINLIRNGYSIWIITLIIIPQYLVFIGIGFGSYVLSLVNLGYYLHRQKWGSLTFFAEFMLHILSAIGIYLGRFKRFNSWDFVTQPEVLAKTTIEDLADKKPLLVIFVTFVVLFVLYWLMKQVVLSVIFRLRYKRTLQAQMAEKQESVLL